ncbi:MAG TPA: MBG domain-containing protein, partial [Chitinophagaceae bacterium]
MKQILLTLLITICVIAAGAQTTYYWVGGVGPVSFSSNSSWNTSLDGSGTTRAAADPNDILIFNGSNIGGAVPATGIVTATITSTTAGQIKLEALANVIFTRTGGTTGTITISGSGPGDDFVIEAGSSLSINSTSANGNVQMIMAVGATGRISGALSLSNTGQQRITCTASGVPGSLVFASGSSFTSNVTSASSSYPFGSNTQSVNRWVVFEEGADLYYEGGWSPMGNNSAFSAIDFKPGSNWHHKATNVIPSVFGSFFNTKSFGNIIVSNNANLNADGPIYRIGNLTINAGSSFNTHTSGQTAILGNILADGNLGAPTGSSNTIVMAGNALQSVSGSGSIVIPSFVVANNADVVLQKNVTVNSTANVFGKLDFNNNKLEGTGSFNSKVNATATGVTGNITAGSYQITGVAGVMANLNGLAVSGAGLPPNTTVVGFSSSNTTINLSAPATAAGTAVALTFGSDSAMLATANPNGFDSTSGSVVVTGTKIFEGGTGYTINGPTSYPFGMSSGAAATSVDAGVVIINAATTINTSVNILGILQLNSGKLTIRPLDTVRILTGASVSGNFNASNYLVTDANTSNGQQGILRIDGISISQLFPIGTPSYYMPVTISPSGASDITTAVFEGITTDGTPHGSQLTATQKLTKVNAVWNINRLAGAGNADVQLLWDQALEGSAFTTLPDADLGIIVNLNPGWGSPVGSGSNTTNTATASFSTLNAFSLGARPPAQSFTFNPLPVKIYGNPDFNGGAISLNTSQPIIYTSSNPSVATIVNGDIHITGTGTADITASQASDGFYPPANVTQTLTVNKATLTIRAADKSKPEGDVNPALTVTYTGFVYGETVSVLTTPVLITTTAVTSSPPGQYPIIPSAATAVNYDIVFVNGVLTISPRQTQTITFNTPPVKTYGNADFAAGATSTNTTIPVSYTSSNTTVATIVGNNIHITGAGTTTITASQPGDALYFPAANVSRTLTVNKANLTVRAMDTIRAVGANNPDFRLTFTGFVLGEGVPNLTTAPAATTNATITSPPGYYNITVANGVSSNYNFIYINGRLTVLP